MCMPPKYEEWMLYQRSIPGTRLHLLREGVEAKNREGLAKALREMLKIVETGITETFEGCEIYTRPYWEKT